MDVITHPYPNPDAGLGNLLPKGVPGNMQNSLVFAKSCQS